jgi:hypothetical protein
VRLRRSWALFAAIACWGIACWAAYTAARWSLARSWTAVSCLITASSIEEDPGPNPYRFRVKYQYTWGGKTYEGRTYQEGHSGSSDIAEADRLAGAYPLGAHSLCYVNPDYPSQSLLEHDNPWVTASLAVVMLCGGAMLILPFRRAGGIIAASVMVMMGLGCYGLGFARPLGRGLRSSHWQATACVVQSAQVRSVDHPPYCRTYWPDLVYRYHFNGVAYRANTYNASDVGSPWYYGSRGIVRRHPPGTVTTCYVNPADPSEAVLVRTLSGTQWFGIWPLMMTVMGAGFLVMAIAGQVPEKIGTPRLWGTLALGAATTSALTALWITGADLFHDSRDGIAAWPEYLGVALAGILAAGLLVGWIALAATRPGRRASERAATTQSVVWDPEIDRTRGGKGRPK